MISEGKVKEHVEDSLQWLERFATKNISEIFKNDFIEAEREIVRLSTLLEVLGEAPSKETLEVLEILKKKLQRL